MLPLLGEFDSVSDEEESDIDREIVEQLDGLKVAMDEQISTIAVNFKVSRELLQQANRSLDTVEPPPQLDHREEDQVDWVRDAPYRHTNSSRASFSTSSANLSGVSAAVGPPSKQYSLFPHRGDDWGKNLEAQLLSRDWELLSQEELALWLSYYPAEQQQYEEGCPLASLSSGRYMTGIRPVGADHSEEEPSHYRSALDSSLLNVHSEKKQQSPPSKVKSASSPEGFVTASKEEELLDTGFPSFTVHRGCSVEEREHSVDEEEEGEMEGASKQEQSEERKDGSSQSHPRVYVEEEEDSAQEELEEMQRELQMEGKMGGENMEDEEEGGAHVEEEEQHAWCDQQSDVEEEDGIDDRRKEITFGSAEETADDVLVKIDELGVDTVTADQKEELRVSPGSQQSPSLLEDTNRAHSTLDDVLLGFGMEGTGRSPGVRILCRLFEGQRGDDKGHPTHTHTAAPVVTQTPETHPPLEDCVGAGPDS
ncbi:uncharacterized protein [Cebidichthys violaceus]|uniref:uncharacterized protein n=1 Tax=Cebidichthys violaceus TaxID=271503 RepID=UPI0035CBEAAB